MRILITSNMGYIGPVVARHLRQQYPDAWLAVSYTHLTLPTICSV